MIFGYLDNDFEVFDREWNHLGPMSMIEEVEFVVSDIGLWVMYGWKRHSNRPGMDSGKGTLVSGDGIMQYSQDINVKAKLRGGVAVLSSLPKFWNAKKLKDQGYQDFLQFSLDEIGDQKFGRFGTVVYLEDEHGERIQVGFPKKPPQLTEFLKEL
jgi:hypothetical protein